MKYIVGKQHVAYPVSADILSHTVSEIAEVYNVYFLKRIEQIPGQGIAITVFHYQQASAVFVDVQTFTVRESPPINVQYALGLPSL